jgi:hypothetical protein
VTVEDVEFVEAFPVALDPTVNTLISCFGGKGTGKSVVNRLVYQSYPFAKLAIDVNGNAEPGQDAKVITAPLPTHMPKPERDPDTGRTIYPNLHFIANPMRAEFRDDLDRAVGMALFPQQQDCLVWCGEVGEFTQANKTGPFLRTLLMQSRHYHCSALFDGPRPVNIDPLVIAQSDVVFVFDLPNPNDRDRIADNIGYPPAEFRRECDETFRRGKYWFLAWDGRTKELIRCAPLPKEAVESSMAGGGVKAAM